MVANVVLLIGDQGLDCSQVLQELGVVVDLVTYCNTHNDCHVSIIFYNQHSNVLFCHWRQTCQQALAIVECFMQNSQVDGLNNLNQSCDGQQQDCVRLYESRLNSQDGDSETANSAANHNLSESSRLCQLTVESFGEQVEDEEVVKVLLNCQDDNNVDCILRVFQKYRSGTESAVQLALAYCLNRLEEELQQGFNSPTVVFLSADQSPCDVQNEQGQVCWLDICNECRSLQSLQVFTLFGPEAQEDSVLQYIYLLLGNIIYIPAQCRYQSAISYSILSVLFQFMGLSMYRFEEDENVDVWRDKKWLVRDTPVLLEDVEVQRDINQTGFQCPWKLTSLDLDRIVEVFKQDKVFRGVVLERFELIASVGNIFSLAQNSLFDKLWQECCRCPELHKYAGIAAELVLAVEKLPKNCILENSGEHELKSREVDWWQLIQNLGWEVSDQVDFNVVRQRVWCSKISFYQPWTPHKEYLFPDKKAVCGSCKKWRSFCLMQQGICGICRSLQGSSCDLQFLDEQQMQPSFQIKRQTSCSYNSEATNLIEETLSRNESHMRECSCCHGIYAVVQVQKANCPGKCHYCRNGRDPPLVECGYCWNLFVFPDKELMKDEPFICSVCEEQPKRSLQLVSSSVFQLCKENPKLLQMFGKQNSLQDQIFKMISLFQIFINRGRRLCQFEEELHTDLVQEENGMVHPGFEQHCSSNDKRRHGLLKTQGAAASESCNLITTLSIVLDYPGLQVFFQRKQVFYEDRLINDLGNVLSNKSHKDLSGTCNLCFEQKSVLRSACGQCSNLVCKGCLKNWYGQTAPGKLVLPSYLSCPFCRRTPKWKILCIANKDAKHVVSMISDQNKERKAKMEFEQEWFYGWCQNCSCVKKAQEKVCSGDNHVPKLNGFTCEECQLDAINLSDTKKCPGCSSPSFLICGCVHVTCPRCNVHWCYICEEKFSEDTIYHHIDTVHGDEGYNEDEEYEDELY
eukprot:TRINITY_DN54708_c0_g1_i3.p1 TRINITY_DN54708_c0_g1~~TRINITY_DN54708_c0_g1_i3.p1  ORF type:complete len:968 (+),score=87.84 TRINITY_DN54708_c0_g1_i3:80-2983(+)